jgi:hypothetical protein
MVLLAKAKPAAKSIKELIMADIEYKTPQDVADEKSRKKAGAAYDKAMPEPDTTTGDFDNFRKQRQGEIAGRQASVDAAKKAKDTAKSKAVYDQSVKKYEREKILNPDGISKSLDKGLDNIGDKVRSVGEFFGSNRMTSMDDKAQMKARKDVKGYAGGGMTASSRADGCATKGKTRGKMV